MPSLHDVHVQGPPLSFAGRKSVSYPLINSDIPSQKLEAPAALSPTRSPQTHQHRQQQKVRKEMEVIIDEIPRPSFTPPSYPNPPATTIVFSIVCGILALCIVSTVLFLLFRMRHRSNDVAGAERHRLSWLVEWRESRKFEPITFAVPPAALSRTNTNTHLDDSAISLPEAVYLNTLPARYPAAPAYTHAV